MPRPKRPRVPCPTEGCDRDAPEGSTCNRCYQREWARQRNGVDPATISVGRAMAHGDQLVRFRARVDSSGGIDACHEWIEGAARTESGYGIVRWDGEDRRAHVVAWEIYHQRPMRPGFIGCHTCDNPPCCNPLHVYEGTKGDNHRDQVLRGRSVDPPTRRGTEHHRAVLSEDQVYAIRAARDAGTSTTVELAAEYGVTRATISEIGRRKRWKHLPERS
jgi:hypothetical protein